MIQWFPGHMAKALRQIEEQKKVVDLFIIVLDSRAPLSCYNPEFDKVIGNKLKLFVFSKADLGDELKLNQLINQLPPNQGVIKLNLKANNSYKRLLTLINQMLSQKKLRDQKRGFLTSTLKIAVVGVPNVGKSTLINLLAKQTKTKVANTPGVTRGKQWINTGELLLLDTPGVLWPKINDINVGIKLATIGLIKDSIINKTELLYHSYSLISDTYPSKIKSLTLKPSFKESEIHEQLIKLCKAKHFIVKNEVLDLNRGTVFLLNYFKSLIGVTYD